MSEMARALVFSSGSMAGVAVQRQDLPQIMMNEQVVPPHRDWIESRIKTALESLGKNQIVAVPWDKR